MTVETIADRIRRILQVRDITASELARRSGMKRTGVSDVLRNLEDDDGAVQVNTLRKIAHGGEVSEEWLLTGNESPLVGEALRAPRYKDLVGGMELLAEARAADPSTPDRVWPIVADSRPVSESPKVAEVLAVAATVRLHADRFQMTAASEALLRRIIELTPRPKQ